MEDVLTVEVARQVDSLSAGGGDVCTERCTVLRRDGGALEALLLGAAPRVIQCLHSVGGPFPRIGEIGPPGAPIPSA